MSDNAANVFDVPDTAGLYERWLAITKRLIESHDHTPGDLIEDLRDFYGVTRDD